MKFVIRENLEGFWSWKLVVNGDVIAQESGYHSEKMCRNAINQIKRTTRFTKVEVLDKGTGERYETYFCSGVAK